MHSDGWQAQDSAVPLQEAIMQIPLEYPACLEKASYHPYQSSKCHTQSFEDAICNARSPFAVAFPRNKLKNREVAMPFAEA